eukprot:COSAG01_NODE_3626_length_5856_cov_134.101963_7_plen_91_part_01
MLDAMEKRGSSAAARGDCSSPLVLSSALPRGHSKMPCVRRRRARAQRAMYAARPAPADSAIVDDYTTAAAAAARGRRSSARAGPAAAAAAA